jgi:hypothetical protein
MRQLQSECRFRSFSLRDTRRQLLTIGRVRSRAPALVFDMVGFR